MWVLTSTTTRWKIYKSRSYPGIHISVSTTNRNEVHATDERNQLHMDRSGNVTRGNAFLRQDFEARYRLSVAITNFLAGGGNPEGFVDRGKVEFM